MACHELAPRKDTSPRSGLPGCHRGRALGRAPSTAIRLMANENSPLQERLAQVLADLLRAAREGLPTDRAELIARHPDLAGHLRAFFAAQDQPAGAAGNTEE